MRTSIHQSAVYKNLERYASLGGGGADGKSAYQLAVDNGFIGTVEQWLDSLIGPAGAQGEQGIQGIQGLQGTPGVGLNRQIYTLAADVPTGANVTPVNVAGLTFNYEANSVYLIGIYGLASPGAATTGLGLQFDLSSVVTRIALQFFHQLANTGTLSGGHSVADDASVGVSSGLPGTGSYPLYAAGILVTGANAGTAQLRLRSETTAIVTLKANTRMIIDKIV